jgi:FlaA1/EpsC-like NDP-sugar epimerase
MVDQAETPLHHLILQVEKAVTSSQIHAVIADIRNYARMDALFQLYQPYVVYHAAAYHHVSLMEPSSSGIYKCNGNKKCSRFGIATSSRKVCDGFY